MKQHYKPGVILFDEVLKLEFSIVGQSDEKWLSEKERQYAYIIQYLKLGDWKMTSILIPESKGRWWSETGKKIYTEAQKAWWQ